MNEHEIEQLCLGKGQYYTGSRQKTWRPKMSDPIRYETLSESVGTLQEHPRGTWVRYEDALTACEIARRDERERVYAEIMDWRRWYSKEIFPDPPKITDHMKTLWSAAVMREMIPRIAESIRAMP